MSLSFTSSPRIVVFDVETTGFSPRLGDRIIEIGAVAVERRNIVEEFSTLIRVDRHIPYQATAVHGITDEMLLGQPCARQVLPRFRIFIGNAPLCAHNARFDMSFLCHELSLLSDSLNNEYHCTVKLSRIHYPNLENYKLETVARHILGKSFRKSDLHRALGDARVTARLLIEMLK